MAGGISRSQPLGPQSVDRMSVRTKILSRVDTFLGQKRISILDRNVRVGDLGEVSQ